MRVACGWHYRAGKWCCSSEQRKVKSDAVALGRIWQHSDYQQCYTVPGDAHGMFSPKPVHLRTAVYHPAYDGDVSIPLLCAVPPVPPPFCSVKVEMFFFSLKKHSAMVLASSGCDSWPRRVSAVEEQGWVPIHIKGKSRGDWLIQLILDGLMWIWLLVEALALRALVTALTNIMPSNISVTRSRRSNGSCGFLQIARSGILWVAFYQE